MKKDMISDFKSLTELADSRMYEDKKNHSAKKH